MLACPVQARDQLHRVRRLSLAAAGLDQVGEIHCERVGGCATPETMLLPDDQSVDLVDLAEQYVPCCRFNYDYVLLHQLRDEADRLGINELLVRNASRIEALGEQRDWLQSLQRQREDLEREARNYENRFAAEQKRLGEALGLDGQRLRELSEADLENLQPHIDGLRLAQKRLDGTSVRLPAGPSTDPGDVSRGVSGTGLL